MKNIGNDHRSLFIGNHFSSIYYMDTTTDHFNPLALRVRGNYAELHFMANKHSGSIN